MNARCIEILNVFINNREVLAYDLAQKFNISKRMIRYDIDEINSFLKENKFNEIDKKPNSPLKFLIDKENKERLSVLLYDFNNKNYIFSSEERINILLYEILSSNNECTYNDLMDKLDISKTTITSDIRKVKEYLKLYNLKIIKVANKGFKVSGEERLIRKAMNSLLTNDNKYNIITTLEKLYNNEKNIKNLDRFNISSENLIYIKSLVHEVEEEFGAFSEEDFMKLVIAIFIIISRGSLRDDDRLIFENKGFDRNYKREYKFGVYLSKKIEDKFNIKVNDHDIDGITSIILAGSKVDKNSFSSQDYFEACSIAGNIIDNLKAKFDNSFKFDNNLYEGFVNHLKSLIFRLKYNINSKNPILDSIMTNYKDEFYLSKEVCSFIDEKYKTHVSDDEIGYIVMYIKAASQKINKEIENEVKNIIIVCQGGLATGRLIESKIKNIFNVNIISVISIHSLDRYVKENEVDFIITSLDLKNEFNVEIIKVNPIINKDDIEKLEKVLLIKEDKKIESIKEILSIIENNCDVLDRDNLIYELNNFIKGREVKERYLKEHINEDFIQLNLEAEDWIDAIRKSAKPLIENKIINSFYVDDMINNVNTFGPYIVVDDLIAIPHSKPNDEINGFGIAITTFKDGITLGEHKGVKIFITIAANNNKNHIDIIKEIMSIIENEENIYRIICAKSKKDILNLIV